MKIVKFVNGTYGICREYRRIYRRTKILYLNLDVLAHSDMEIWEVPEKMNYYEQYQTPSKDRVERLFNLASIPKKTRASKRFEKEK